MNFVHIPSVLLHVRLFSAHIATVVTFESLLLFMNCKIKIISFLFNLKRYNNPYLI